tara:strand:- start:669 stop:1073 length:405 start_codon:yes stop_codon:yes gene_type:complete
MFKIIFSFIALYFSMLSNIYAGDLHDHSSHNHAHIDVDGSKTKIDPDKYNNFVKDLSSGQVAIVDVKGMVCDFCARGIEKTFYDDKEVKKVSVDLGAGKVLVAYSDTKRVDIDEIKNIFLINGQTATNVIVNQL